MDFGPVVLVAAMFAVVGLATGCAVTWIMNREG